MYQTQIQIPYPLTFDTAVCYLKAVTDTALLYQYFWYFDDTRPDACTRVELVTRPRTVDVVAAGHAITGSRVN